MDWIPLTESSLQRIFSNTEKYDSGIITAWRGRYDKGTNRARNKEMMGILKQYNFPYVHVQGRYGEFGSQGPTTEESIIVYDIGNSGNNVKSARVDAPFDNASRLFNLLFHLGKKYNQDAIIFKPMGDIAYTIGTSHLDEDGKVITDPGYRNIKPLGKLNPMRKSSELTQTSKIAGKSADRYFNFESIEHFPHSRLSTLGKRS
jgi:hypothetical protein